MAASRAALLFAVLLLAPSTASAQGWSADLYAGSSLYEPAAASLRATSLIAGVRRGSPLRTWLYAAVAAPLDDGASAWGAAGATHRQRRGLGSRGSGAGFDAGAHGYAYRDDVSQVTGTGVTLDAGAFVDAARRGARAELRAGVRHHLADDGPQNTSRTAPEGSLRLEPTMELPVRAGALVRVVRVDEGTYPMVGADVAALAGPLRLWATGERWLASDVDDFGWSINASVPIGRADLWAGLREDAPDPLYWNPVRRTWSAGVTIALGRNRAPVLVQPAVAAGGTTLIRLPRSAAQGALSVAGDFSGWEPRRMTQAGDWWEIRMQLGPGTYHFAFVDEHGRWFVPEDVPGRMDDGMGGHVAVLVVP